MMSCSIPVYVWVYIHVHVYAFPNAPTKKLRIVFHEKESRGHPDLNQGPLDLQSNALPLSYTPDYCSLSLHVRVCAVYFSPLPLFLLFPLPRPPPTPPLLPPPPSSSCRGFQFPSDMHLEPEYWADSGALDEVERHHHDIITNQLFTVAPKTGRLAPGESVSILCSFK